MVSLTRIYTRTGDGGQTRLADNSPSPKTDVRLEAYGTLDEANCAIGLALTLHVPHDVATVLRAIQQELFVVGADLATPVADDPSGPPPRVDDPAVERLEAWCDQFGASLPELRSFVVPGGCALAAQLHVARTVVRRAERAAWQAAAVTGVHPTALRYLNRLSDLLFVLARYANAHAAESEVLWAPDHGGARA